MSDSKAPDWVIPMMRTGYSARGIVYCVLGALTIWAAWTGGRAQGTEGALQTIKGQPFGVILLWIVGLGFFCYAAWRMVAAWYDLENRGEDEKGLFARGALVVTGLIHAALGVGIVTLAMGNRGGSGGGAADWTAKLMQMPGGKWLAAIAALSIAGAGVQYMIKGYKKKYERHIEVTQTTRKLSPLLRWGYVAYGIVLVVVGVYLGIAALTTDPSEAKGIGGALEAIRGVAFGRIILGLIGLGIVGFGVANFVEACYRIVPGVGSSDKLRSLAA